MIIKQVQPNDEKVKRLIDKLNDYQIGLYGLSACNLESPESLVKNGAFMIGAYIDDVLAGIGAIKIVSDYAEVKRMYVEEEFRGVKIASGILRSLEGFAEISGIRNIFLETGIKHDAAITFYKNHG